MPETLLNYDNKSNGQVQNSCVNIEKILEYRENTAKYRICWILKDKEEKHELKSESMMRVVVLISYKLHLGHEVS